MRLLFLLLLTATSLAKVPDLSATRKSFLKACESEEENKMLLKGLGCFPGLDIISKGYHAAATVLQAKYTINPVSKISYCKKGLPILDSLIVIQPNLIELRYLRFLMEYNIPLFLNMSPHVEKDKKYLIANFKLLKDEELKRMIATALLKSNKCTQEEKELISSNAGI